MTNTQLKVKDLDTDNVFYVEVPDTVDCANMKSQFPANPTDAEVAKLTQTLPANDAGKVWKSLECALPDTGKGSEKIKAIYIRRIDGFKQLSIYADGTGVLKTALVATGGTPSYPISDGLKTMTTADGPYSSAGLFTGTVPYGSLYSNVPDGTYYLRVIDEDNLFITYDLVITDTLPDAVLLAPIGSVEQKATKITDTYIGTNGDVSPFSLSVYARGTGDIQVEVSAIEGTPVYPNGSKKMLTESGGYTRSNLFIGAVPYGSLFPNLIKGKYAVRLIDSAGGVDSYNLNVPNEGVSLVMKGTAAGVENTGGSGGSGGSDGSVPTMEFLGNATVSECGRLDLMNLVVTVFRKADGTWWFKVKDTATGNFPDKVYLTIQGEHFIRQAELEAAEFPFGFPWSCVCGQQPWATGQDGGVMDRSAHCSVKVYTE